MAGPADADYRCTLDAKSLEKAIKELNEDPKNRIGAVETFRQWIIQQKHISCPTDITFLLPFLRVRYYSQLEARTLLENFLIRRSKFPYWFKNLDPNDKVMQKILDTGIYLMLPEKDDEGRQVMLVRPGRMNTKSKDYGKYDVFKALALILDTIYLTDENALVNGTVSLIDFGGYTLSHQTYMSVEDRRDFMHTWQANYPARVKQVHFYNMLGVAEFVLGIVKFMMPEKIQQRLKVHSNSLEGVYKDIPMRLLPVEYLPDDYTGPNAGTEQEIIEYTKRRLSTPEVRDRLIYWSKDKWGVDESKRPTVAQSVPSASFRKLNLED